MSSRRWWRRRDTLQQGTAQIEGPDGYGGGVSSYQRHPWSCQRGWEHASAYPSNVEISVQQAWEESGYGPGDMDVVQAYDTMASSELWDLEKMGFCGKGEAPRLLREGAFDISGTLPVNTDGGLMSRGHPIGATALAQIIEIYKQIRGEAGPRQVPRAKIGLAHVLGGGSNSGVVILKR